MNLGLLPFFVNYATQPLVLFITHWNESRGASRGNARPVRRFPTFIGCDERFDSAGLIAGSTPASERQRLRRPVRSAIGVPSILWV